MNKENTNQKIIEIAKSWEEHPEMIAEAVAFSSKFYRYSLRNTLLIQEQNPYAVYVQSYKDWKKMGWSVKRGEHGMRIMVPMKSTVLKINGELVPLQHATKEDKERYKKGEIESITDTKWGWGNVFDISQTNYPEKDYPKLFSMGIPSFYCADAIKGLSDYAKDTLGCSVVIEDLKSISLRGDYRPGMIRLNDRLEDTQRLDTLSHEIGHAVMDHTNKEMTRAQKEFEADAFSIMLSDFLGVELTDGRKRHLAEHYKRILEQDKDINPLEVLIDVQRMYREQIDNIKVHLEQYIDMDHVQLSEELLQPDYVGKTMATEKQLRFAGEIAKTLSLALPKEANRQVLSEFIEHYRDDFFKVKNAEQLELIKSTIKITDYAKELGLSLTKVGRYYSTKEYDSLRIDPDKNCFYRNSEKGIHNAGSIIDFSAEFAHNGDHREAIKELKERLESGVYMLPVQSVMAAKKEVRPEGIVLPQAAPNMHRAYAYLIKTRFIDQDIVQDFVNRKMLYQDERGNCVFVARDEQMNPTFAFRKGTLSEKKFFGEISGSDYKKGFYIDNHAKQLIVTESVIDSMSVMTILKGQGMDPKQYDYLALTGTGKYDLVLRNLQTNPKEKVLLALDNDVAGIKATANILKTLEEHKLVCDVSYHLPETKDWNEDLCKVAKKFDSLTKIPFLDESKIKDLPHEDGKITVKGFATYPDDPKKNLWCIYEQDKKEDMSELYVRQDKEHFELYFYAGTIFDKSVVEHTLSPREMREAFLYQYEAYRQGIECGWSEESEDHRNWMEAGKVKDNPFTEVIRQQELQKNREFADPELNTELEL